jgi:hypothetical protein
VKARDKFHVSTAVGVKSELVDICKSCAEEIAMPTIDGVKQ